MESQCTAIVIKSCWRLPLSSESLGRFYLWHQYCFQCDQPGPLFQRRTSPKREEVPSWCAFGPTHLSANNLSPWGNNCLGLWQGLVFENTGIMAICITQIMKATVILSTNFFFKKSFLILDCLISFLLDHIAWKNHKSGYFLIIK